MGIYKQLPHELREVDVIIAGGGTTACVIASRLSDADPELSILVLESGPDNYNEPGIVHPGLFLGNLLPTSKNNTFHMAKASDDIAKRPLPVPAGRVLGGGSSINTMAYARGQGSDYDSWEAPGWLTKELCPYLNKFETYYGDGVEEHHGTNGPIHVSEGSHRYTKALDDFLSTTEELGWSENKDLQSTQRGAIDGVQKSLRYVSKDGKRQDAAHCYLHPRLRDGKHPNLHVAVETEVVRVIFEEQTAVGVICQPNPEFSSGQSTTVKARKLVIVSCGAFGSPTLLERSGVGQAALLNQFGIPLVEDLPGVGTGYEDHQAMNYAYKTSLGPEETSDAVVFGYSDPQKLIAENAPVLGHNGQEAGLKIRPSDEEVSALGPEFQNAWDLHFKERLDKPLALMAFITCFPGYDPDMQKEQYLGMSVFTSYPFSRGHVHIGGKSPSDPVDFDTGFLADADSIDVKKHIWGYKKQREVMRRMDCYRGEFASWHPPFPATSEAACVEVSEPLGKNIPPIRYTSEDDAIIEQFVREKVGSLWHSMGTCKMAPREKDGVVDERLGVYGLKRLKIADMSITPGNVGANTASTAFAIGEKAADLFLGELGLR
ncbi:alcohol oxidase [Fusarium flagelliforme]|uniref:Alcohol oxidase n=1 Tax=Fusarium flagelliforme TaxID=2675880 RepID=A0A395M7E0_9HYPO|nr:alcohol oxidase [Fusarium flagelliforme]